MCDNKRSECNIFRDSHQFSSSRLSSSQVTPKYSFVSPYLLNLFAQLRKYSHDRDKYLRPNIIVTIHLVCVTRSFHSQTVRSIVDRPQSSRRCCAGKCLSRRAVARSESFIKEKNSSTRLAVTRGSNTRIRFRILLLKLPRSARYPENMFTQHVGNTVGVPWSITRSKELTTYISSSPPPPKIHRRTSSGDGVIPRALSRETH